MTKVLFVARYRIPKYHSRWCPQCNQVAKLMFCYVQFAVRIVIYDCCEPQCQGCQLLQAVVSCIKSGGGLCLLSISFLKLLPFWRVFQALYPSSFHTSQCGKNLPSRELLGWFSRCLLISWSLKIFIHKTSIVISSDIGPPFGLNPIHGQKAMHMSPPCISTGMLKKVRLLKSTEKNNWCLWIIYSNILLLSYCLKSVCHYNVVVCLYHAHIVMNQLYKNSLV